MPTPSWRVFTIYIDIYVQQYTVHYFRIQILTVHSTLLPDPNTYSTQYFNTGSKYLQYTTGFWNNPCILGLVQHRVQYRLHIENSTLKIPVHIWYSTYVYCIHTSGLFNTQYIFTGTVHTECPKASAYNNWYSTLLLQYIGYTRQIGKIIIKFQKFQIPRTSFVMEELPVKSDPSR